MPKKKPRNRKGGPKTVRSMPVSMHEAKTHLSRLVKEEFVITNNGEPVARVTPLGVRSGTRFGFLPAQLARENRP